MRRPGTLWNHLFRRFSRRSTLNHPLCLPFVLLISRTTQPSLFTLPFLFGSLPLRHPPSTHYLWILPYWSLPKWLYHHRRTSTLSQLPYSSLLRLLSRNFSPCSLRFQNSTFQYTEQVLCKSYSYTDSSDPSRPSSSSPTPSRVLDSITRNVRYHFVTRKWDSLHPVKWVVSVHSSPPSCEVKWYLPQSVLLLHEIKYQFPNEIDDTPLVWYPSFPSFFWWIWRNPPKLFSGPNSTFTERDPITVIFTTLNYFKTYIKLPETIIRTRLIPKSGTSM